MKTLGLFDALKILDFDQVLIQVNNVAEGYGYHQEGNMIHFDKNKGGRLINYKTGEAINIGKPVTGEDAQFIIKDIKDL